jgi:hypothetical protein
MPKWLLSVSALILLVSCAIAQDEPGRLPIDVPKEASVNFEAEGRGRDFLGSIKHLLNGNMADPTAPSADRISVKTPLGDIDLKVDDLKPLLDKFDQLHVVSYTRTPNEDPLKRYENRFSRDGMQKVTSIPGDKGILIMRRRANHDCYGIVARQGESVVVLRTEGAPGLGDFGKVLFEALTHAVQQATNRKKG